MMMFRVMIVTSVMTAANAEIGAVEILPSDVAVLIGDCLGTVRVADEIRALDS